MLPSLDIILVNRNSGGELRKCLASVARAEKTAFWLRRVCVVDDASTDDSATGCGEIPLPLEIVRNPEPRDTEASCNRGAENSTADYILFLNTDTVLFADSLDLPIRYMEQAEQFGHRNRRDSIVECEGRDHPFLRPLPDAGVHDLYRARPGPAFAVACFRAIR